MSGKRLTLAKRLQVACYHSFGSKHPQWVVDSTHGHPVCSHCGKPSPELVIRFCSECDDEFVIEFNWKWAPKYFLVAGKVYEQDFQCPPCF